MPANLTGGELAALLRRRRRHAGLSQQALADLSTVSVRAIRDLESGRATRPRRDTVNLLADGLRVGAAERSALLAAIPGPVVPAGVATVRPAPASLPVAPSAMIGRGTELGVLRDLVTVARERLVAIVGVSGVGKTRLAIEFARELHAEHGRDVRWITASDDRLAAILRDDSVDRRTLDDLAAAGDVLLVLDGPDAAAGSAGLATVLNACPAAQILLTTDDPDAVVGWTILPLAPLPVPAEADGDAARFDAVRLLDRHLRGAGADAADPGTLAAICRLVDGLPATLELVGQWATVHTLDRLAAELSRDPCALASWPAATGAVYDPGASLRRSYARLAPPARELLAIMAAAGSWSVSTAAEHTGRPICDVARDVHALLRHGHVRRIDTAAGPQFVVLRLARRVARELGERPRPGRITGIDRRVPATRVAPEHPTWGVVIDRSHAAALPADRTRQRVGAALAPGMASAARHAALGIAEAS